MTRRFTTCKCCGGFSASAYCDGCGAHHVQRAAVVQAVIRALWGSAGLTQYETEVRGRRLATRRTARPANPRKRMTGGTS